MGPAGCQVDALLESRGILNHIQPQDLRLAGIRQEQGGQDGNEGSLASAVGTQNAEDGAGGNLKVNLTEHLFGGTPKSGAEGLANALGCNGC